MSFLATCLATYLIDSARVSGCGGKERTGAACLGFRLRARRRRHQFLRRGVRAGDASKSAWRMQFRPPGTTGRNECGWNGGTRGKLSLLWSSTRESNPRNGQLDQIFILMVMVRGLMSLVQVGTSWSNDRAITAKKPLPWLIKRRKIQHFVLNIQLLHNII